MREYNVPRMALLQSQKLRMRTWARMMTPMGMRVEMRPDEVAEMTQPRLG